MIRRGPKFEVTLEMALENLRTVAARLGRTSLSHRQYDREGSFSARNLERAWGWATLYQLAGLSTGIHGCPRKARRPCMECDVRLSRTIGRLCRTCHRRICALDRGAL